MVRNAFFLSMIIIATCSQKNTGFSLAFARHKINYILQMENVNSDRYFSESNVIAIDDMLYVCMSNVRKSGRMK
jgi:hypothetical protein